MTNPSPRAPHALRSGRMRRVQVQLRSLLASLLMLLVYPSAQAASAPPTVPDALRFLNQSSFGPSATALARVQQLGIAPYLDEQLALASVSGYRDLIAYVPSTQPTDCKSDGVTGSAASICARDKYSIFQVQRRFHQNAIAANDQLRQRVAFALSQIHVISAHEIRWAYAMATYQQILLDNAFGNFRNILHEITLSPAMGRYLDMVNNDKPNPARGTEPNENYARELLQLFSIGVVKLNQDGTPILQGGKPVPSYGQDEIEGFAHVFTGWTYPVRPGASGQTHNPSNFEGLMVAVAAQHDTGQKTLLNGVKLPAGQTAAKDLNDAIDNVFSHPNLGPFIGRQLIAHLVTSNPSTAYVARVAAAFANNGQGVRGDMKAVLRAILLDAEARGDAKTANTYGKLIEPAMFAAGVIRALNGQSDGVYLRAQGAGLGQDVFNAESVFSFYPPDLPLPGNATLVGPEFGVYNSSTSLARIAFLERVVMGGTIAADATVAGATGTSIDLSRWQSLAGNASNLIDQLAVLLVPGTLPANTKNAILNYVNGIAATDTLGRTRAAAYFLAATTLHQVQR